MTKPLFEIRPALADEADALSKLAWKAKAHWAYSAAQLERWRDGLMVSTQSIIEQPTFVAERDGAFMGFCQLNLHSSPVELEHLWIHPASMRQGIGRALLTRCLQQLKALGIDSLHIDSDPNAAPFYIHCGAIQTGTVAAPIEDQPDRVRPQFRIATG